MPKQPVNINFSQGLNTKVDPWQLPIGQFSRLQNSVFDKGGQLKKVNGFGALSSLPNSTYSYLTTFKNDLTAIGSNIAAYNSGNQTWVTKGSYTPLTMSTLSLIKNTLNQTQVDAAISTNNLLCVVYSELNNATTTYKYAILDQTTGQVLVSPTLIPKGTGTVTGAPRVFYLGQYFVIVFTNVISAISHLQYIAISSLNLSSVTTAQDISSNYTSATTLSWGGVVFNNNLYLAYNTTSGGQSVKVTYLSSSSAATGSSPVTPTTFATNIATMMSLCVDQTVTTPLVYISFYDAAGSTGYTCAVDTSLNKILNPVQIISSGAYLNITSAAQNGSVLVFLEASNNYSFDSSIPSHYVRAISVTSTGTVGTLYNVIRSVGLASKAFIVSGKIYFLSIYQSPFQPTYFLINGSTSTQSAPVIVAKLAYENAGGYLTTGLPQASISGTNVLIPYLYKDLAQSLTVTNTTQQTTTGGIYSQTGINVCNFNFENSGINTVDLGNNLHLSGGFMGMYDGYLPVEQNFFLWPDSIELTTSTTGGSLTAQQYYYQVTYEWTDNQGNIHRSAGSIPVTITTTGSNSTITLNIPTLRLTMKTATAVKIVIYRWSAAQPVYHQVTSITAPTLNDTTVDSISYVDGQADSAIVGNSIIYTTGGVIEDINAPATNIMTVFDTRLWMVDAEDQDLLWYSKQVIESTPVEMSDLLTFYVAPNTGTTATTGPITALAPMDDKLIIFKKDAIYYINGSGPDNTGANNQYSQPIFISSVVGCDDQRSVVLMNDGLMFQSNKGIWLLTRGLAVSYVGAPVEDFNSSTVNSANNIPATNQVRQTLDTGETLMFDYYYQQWSTLVGAPAISSTIYNDSHTMITKYGQVLQETQGQYLNAGNPVLMGFSTGWINLASLQGYERFYYFYLLGKYLSPHKLRIQICYDYNESTAQSLVISPNNYSASPSSPYGDQPAPFGSPTNLEQWKIHIKKQKCQSFKIAVDEIFDPSFGTEPGAGLTLSGINMVVLVKRATRPIKAANTVG